MGARIPVLTNLNIGTWSKLVITTEDELVVSFLTYGYLAGYNGLVHSLSWESHASAN